MNLSLVYRIIIRLSIALLPLIMLWSALFYFKMIDEINDETDDALEDYSELIIMRFLADEQLPNINIGSNNHYNISYIHSTYASTHPTLDNSHAKV